MSRREWNGVKEREASVDGSVNLMSIGIGNCEQANLFLTGITS
ncbi:hypothetical protein [Paenibacillus allorhizoplanae]|nr:hypothetical protein [Paenibacillus allorhizoplanae]